MTVAGNERLTDTPFGWCWDADMAMYLPVYTSLPVAPRELESFVSCNCHGSCSKNICTCFQNSVKCLPSKGGGQDRKRRAGWC